MPYQSGKKVLMFYSDIYMLHLQYKGMTDVKLKFECNRIAVKPSAVKLTSTFFFIVIHPDNVILVEIYCNVKKTKHFIAI